MINAILHLRIIFLFLDRVTRKIKTRFQLMLTAPCFSTPMLHGNDLHKERLYTTTKQWCVCILCTPRSCSGRMCNTETTIELTPEDVCYCYLTRFLF